MSITNPNDAAEALLAKLEAANAECYNPNEVQSIVDAAGGVDACPLAGANPPENTVFSMLTDKIGEASIFAKAANQSNYKSEYKP